MQESLNEDTITLSRRQRRLLGTFAATLTFEDAERLSQHAVKAIARDEAGLESSSPQMTGWANPITAWHLRRERAALAAFTSALALPVVDLDAPGERAVLYEINPIEGLPSASGELQ